MRFSGLKQDRGVAGLSIFLSLITMIFAIGLIVMVFALMGSELLGTTTDATAIAIINDTTVSLSTVPDWFPLFIVIGAMVVVILLTVIIIGAIKGFGGFGGQGEV